VLRCSQIPCMWTAQMGKVKCHHLIYPSLKFCPFSSRFNIIMLCHHPCHNTVLGLKSWSKFIIHCLAHHHLYCNIHTSLTKTTFVIQNRKQKCSYFVKIQIRSIWCVSDAHHLPWYLSLCFRRTCSFNSCFFEIILSSDRPMVLTPDPSSLYDD
jgi:hypothetical protein